MKTIFLEGFPLKPTETTQVLLKSGTTDLTIPFRDRHIFKRQSLENLKVLIFFFLGGEGGGGGVRYKIDHHKERSFVCNYFGFWKGIFQYIEPLIRC